jgi:hypothetical protein
MPKDMPSGKNKYNHIYSKTKTIQDEKNSFDQCFVYIINVFWHKRRMLNESNVDGLMKKMTLDEKIGQLNLLTPGSGIPTGSVVSTDVEKKIKEGKVGGLFGVIGRR